MSMPSFLLIGAAKAGTSAFFRFLTTHPDVFGAPVKEPNFFAFEGRAADFRGPGDEEINRRTVSDLGTYRSLFGGAGKERARGEASTIYLYWPSAAEAIARHLPEVRIIALLRDPVERAFSSYLHLRRDGFETLSFEDALEAEGKRVTAGWQPLWHYLSASRYPQQLGRFLECFPRDQLLIHLYEDFAKQPGEVLRSTYRFLGVDPEFEQPLGRRFNVSGPPRSRRLQRALVSEGAAKRAARRVLPRRWRSRLWRTLTRANVRSIRPQMRTETRARLCQLFRQERAELEDTLECDLSCWLREEAKS